MAKYDPSKPGPNRRRRDQMTREEYGRAQQQDRLSGNYGDIIRDDGTVIPWAGGMASATAPGYQGPITGWKPNPAFGGNPFEPTSQLPMVPVSPDPSLAKPLPSGRYIDANIPSPLAAARASEIEEYKGNPQKYVDEKAPELVQEESLLDKGMNMLGRILDYRDEADLSLFGINLSAVESTFDQFNRTLTGFYDVINVGIGWGLSALPGGIQTLDGGQLSGEKTFLEVLNGEMEPGSAPSPGQILVASGAADALKLRNGDITGAANILAFAGLLAPDSPLQQPGFDITNKEQRDEAFGQGPEKYLSGMSDVAFMFADPLIGAGVAAKAMRLGALGQRSSAKTAELMGSASRASLDEIAAVPDNAFIKDTPEFWAQIDAQNAAAQARRQQGMSFLDYVDSGQPIPAPAYKPQRIYTEPPKDGYANPLATVYHRLARWTKDADGKDVKAMSVDDIANMPEIRNLHITAEAADLLHKAEDPLQVALVIESLMGTRGSLAKLMKLSPSKADTVLRMQAERIAHLRVTEPAKMEEAVKALDQEVLNLRAQRESLKSSIDKRREAIDPATRDRRVPDYITGPKNDPVLAEMENRLTVLDSTINDTQALKDIATGQRRFDPLDPDNPYYVQENADAIIDDLHRQEDFVTKALNAEIEGAARSARMQFALKDNWYGRMVTESRFRRAEARSRYAEEGTSVFVPHWVNKRVNEQGIIERELDWMPANVLRAAREGWEAHDFHRAVKGVYSEGRRQVRVWRWAGTETPSGYIGLKGTATVNSEREFAAALDTDLYRGDGVEVMLKQEDGSFKPHRVGGKQARQKYTEMFMAGLNDPQQDSLTVLKNIERLIAKDYAEVYFPNVAKKDAEKLIFDALDKADGIRTKAVEELRRRGYFVDTESGTVQYAPYLRSQLANGTYMLNWHAMESGLNHGRRGQKHQSVMQGVYTGAHYAAEADKMFQNFWRPLTLMRLSYTQRNVFEGMLRAMAYQASLAPLTWPVKGTYFGVRNKITKSRVNKQVKQAQAAIESSPEFRRIWDEYGAASQEQRKYSGMFRFTGADDAEEMRVLVTKNADGDTVVTKMTEDEWSVKMGEAQDRFDAAEAALRANEDAFTRSVEGTAFGDWRKKEIKDLTVRLAEYDRTISGVVETMMDHLEGKATITDDIIGHGIAETLAARSVVLDNIENLRYRPMYAMQMFREHAGRQRRIGSGTSIGPDGNYYQDAFVGPMEQLNRGLMSADNTTKQQLSLVADMWGNLFQRVMVRQNRPIQYVETGQGRTQWADGLASVIEDLSSNEIVRVLLQNDMDVDTTLRWLMSPDGERYASGLRKLFGSGDDLAPNFMDDEIMDILRARNIEVDSPTVVKGKGTNIKGDEVTTYRLKEFSEDVFGSRGERQPTWDIEAAARYVQDVQQKMIQQMQGIPEFMELLRRRVAIKGKGARGTGDVPVSHKEIEAILDVLTPEQRASLRFVQGSEVIQMGSQKFLDIYEGFINKMFRALGTIPEDAIVRGPFYNQRFKAVRNDLIENYWYRRGYDIGDVRASNRKVRDSAGREIEGGIAHPQFVIPSDELAKIEVKAHRQALLDVKEYMYTIDRRTKLGKYGEYIFPFISATQNSTVVAGKLLYRNPWLAPLIRDIWQAPNRLGIEDEDGNITMPLPKPVVDWLKDNPDIPFLGGVISDGEYVTIPKDGMNVFMPDTGFGLVPRPTPLVQVAASELMKSGAFPIETPKVFYSMFQNPEDADAAYQMVKEYIFGEQGSVSDKFASWDKVTPAWIQRLMEMKDSLGPEYGYEFAMIYNTEMMRWRGGERDTKPDPAEIHKRTTNMFWFKFAGNMGLPTPLTPYPVLTRPTIQHDPVQVLAETYQKMKGADPANANMNFYNLFGDWALEAANTKVSHNLGGADATAKAVSDIKTFDPLIRQAVGLLSENNYDLIGILVNNRGIIDDPATEAIEADPFDSNAYSWQKTAIIPGTNKTFREIQSPEEALAERQRIVGWTTYRAAMDQLDAMLASRGLSSYEASGAADLKNAKNVMVANMANNPDMAGWWVDYQDASGQRTTSAVRVLEMAVADDTFRRTMTQAGKTNLLNAMDQYVYYRRGVVQAIDAMGGINEPQNAMLKQGWLNIRQNLKNSDPRFATIMDMYLSGDENPQFPGNFVDEATMAMVRGEVVGNR